MIIATISDSSAISLQLITWLMQYNEQHHLKASILNVPDVDDLLTISRTQYIDTVFICLTGPKSFEKARSIRAFMPDAKLVFVTDTQDYVVKCLRLHFTDYIVLPIELKAFERAMKLAELTDGE